MPSLKELKEMVTKFRKDNAALLDLSDLTHILTLWEIDKEFLNLKVQDFLHVKVLADQVEGMLSNLKILTDSVETATPSKAGIFYYANAEDAEKHNAPKVESTYEAWKDVIERQRSQFKSSQSFINDFHPAVANDVKVKAMLSQLTYLLEAASTLSWENAANKIRSENQVQANSAPVPSALRPK